MAQFKNIGFTFDGVSGEDLGYFIVNTGSDNGAVMGTSRTIQEEETNNFAKSFQGVKYNAHTFEITIAKVKKNGDASPITEEDIFFLNNWLLKPNDYRIFISHQNRDILYYAIFTEATDYLNGRRQGYIKLKMRLSSGCSYSTVAHHKYTMEHYKTIEIYNKSNVEEYIYPDVNFITRHASGTAKVTIENQTLGEVMEFKSLPSGIEVMCYNEGLKQVVCLSDKTINLRPNFNKQWLRLAYGCNVIKVTGNCTIDIFFQNKIAIQN